MAGHCIKAAALVLAIAIPAIAHAEGPGPSVEDRLRVLEDRQAQLEQKLRERDARIQELEAAQARAPEVISRLPSQTEPASGPDRSARADETQWGDYEGGKGMVLVRSDKGELDLGVFSYARYQNEHGLDPTYTDAFGRTSVLDRGSDLQLQKVTLNFKGWLIDPDFRYLFYAWTSNANQGLGAQVVLGGYLTYHFSDAINVGAGINSLPTTRSTIGTFPNWLKNDNRTMADEYFRGSFTSGVWAWGKLARGVEYHVMLGNNLSQLGVDASQLDNQFDTVSAALSWMPTTGEYGPATGFGDWESHQKLATLFGVHFTRSPEDAQSQPGTDSFENSQIRLSDGTLLFSADPFNTGGRVRKATYQMLAVNGGFKYRGFSLDGEVYTRWVNDFDVIGPIPVDHLFDQGFQLQASAMVLPKTLQAYASGSKIFGEYGDPWDVALGVNWYPFQRRELRLNAQALYMDRSPVGYTSVPYIVGGKGLVFSSDVIVAF